ncbi:hypothetical protein BDR04DRAFT_575184 [Suillus decipiens]|nr:hypothetical protein BDR04DRAFT_575184 [Suillus decipiens]
MPNTGMYMGQFHWPQPAYIPSYAPAHPYHPGVLPNEMHGAAPTYVAPSPGVGAGVANMRSKRDHMVTTPCSNRCLVWHSCWSIPTAKCGCSSPTTRIRAPSIPSTFPIDLFQELPHALHIPHQGCLNQYHGPPLATGSAFSFLPQVSSFSVSLERVAQYLEGGNFK